MSNKFTSPAEIAMLNIAHFSTLLRTPLDRQKRGIIERLLANERAKLNMSRRGAITEPAKRLMRPAGREKKMADRDLNRSLLSAYRNSIRRYQRLLKTYQTDVEQSYIKERLLACKAAVKALGPERLHHPDHS